MVNEAICPETDKWGKEYVALPSIFINGPDSMFYAGNEKLVKAEMIMEKLLYLHSFGELEEV